MSILLDENDPMGSAISDFYRGVKNAEIIVSSPDFDDDIIPVSYLFRSFEEMPKLEQLALELSKGKILDVGAAAGCHSLELQKMKKTVDAIDISAMATEIQQGRGVQHSETIDIFDLTDQKYDTILCLMNGIGIAERVSELPRFFIHLKNLLNPNGQVLIDSSDLKYLFQEEDGSFYLPITGQYYGEVEYTMSYRNIIGESFSWLYLDYDLMNQYATAAGFRCEKVFDGEHYDYLARLIL